ncbi:MAG: hypothetical protein U1E39_02990 [Planctomycetota bacterium]
MLAALPAAPRLPAVAAAVCLLVAVVVLCRRTGWTKTRRTRARVLLYGATAALLGALAWWGAAVREEGRQDALLTRVAGADVMWAADPARARGIFEEVLAASPTDDTRRRALLGLAAALTQLEAYADAETTYATADAEWGSGRPRGALLLPWATMRLRAGRARDALTLLDSPGASDGFGTPEESARIHADLRARAQRALESPPAPAAGSPR